DVKAIRERLGKSQAGFARMIGVSVSTLQNWEQGRRRPVGPARALLEVAGANPRSGGGGVGGWPATASGRLFSGLEPSLGVVAGLQPFAGVAAGPPGCIYLGGVGSWK